ncbi:hypothetical protein AUJ46_04425 [Candidatus Peregrinibacteria bacterium CG1_02_54_53]|nr:MAG: hypothetical protein AUJ46_04425 [Candidatus Peregrinibacteria bacterium CG1_02_54_53]
MFRVELTKSAEKDVCRLSKKDQGRIFRGLESLKNDPFSGKKLQGPLEGLWSLRVWPYRIIYEIQKKKILVTVIAVKQRKNVYKKY